MGAGRKRDIDHLRTPPDQRGSWWWLVEHQLAEVAVTSAAGMVDHAIHDAARCIARQQLDRRLDWLEVVEDNCDAILVELRKLSPSWLVEACEARFMRGESWTAIAARLGMSKAVLVSKCERAVRMLDQTAPDRSKTQDLKKTACIKLGASSVPARA